MGCLHSPARPICRERRQIMSTAAPSQAYIEAAIASETSKVASASLGERNNTLFKSTAALGSLHPHLDEHEAKSRLQQAAKGLIHTDGLKSTRATIDSGWRAGGRNARQFAANDNFAKRSYLGNGQINPEYVAARPSEAAVPAMFPPWTATDEVGKPKFFAG